MAMRLYSTEEFEADIVRRWGLTPTDKSTATAKLWKTRGGRFILVPFNDSYPDYVLDLVKERIEAAEKTKVPWE